MYFDNHTFFHILYFVSLVRCINRQLWCFRLLEWWLNSQYCSLSAKPQMLTRILPLTSPPPPVLSVLAFRLETSLGQSEQRAYEFSRALAQSEEQLGQLQVLSQSQSSQIQQLQDVCTQLNGVREMNEVSWRTLCSCSTWKDSGINIVLTLLS